MGISARRGLMTTHSDLIVIIDIFLIQLEQVLSSQRLRVIIQLCSCTGRHLLVCFFLSFKLFVCRHESILLLLQ